MAWHQVFKLWKMATYDDPANRRLRIRDIEGAGVTVPEAMPDLRSDGGYLSGNRGSVSLRGGSDLVDITSVSNRQGRYKEYDKLRNVAEINTALQVFSDESCVTGDTPVATPFGYIPIKQLTEEKQPDEEFLVYCYDFDKEDYTLGWAFHPRLVKRAPTVKILLDNGTSFSCTADHKVLLRTGEWIEAGQLQDGDELMPFYRLKADQALTEQKQKQFARVFTLKDGWKSERQFIEEWKMGCKDENQSKLSQLIRYIQGGLTTRQIGKLMKRAWSTLDEYLTKEGFSFREVRAMGHKFKDRRIVIRVVDNGEQDVYDLSVRDHENFATNTTIFHNCQIGENGHLFDIVCKNKDIKEELEFLFFHPKMLNMDRKLWNIAYNLYLKGDHFIELVIDTEEPKAGIFKIQNLPPESMYRIESIKGKLIEFQQSIEGPDYKALERIDVATATPAELAQSSAIRFCPEQIVHFRIGDDRQTFRPYGIALVEAARQPAHQLRLMEDAMLVYRLTRAPERRVFYIDVGQLPPFKAEGFMERMKDMLRKKKTFSARGGAQGASPVEERWTAPSQDEDFWIPLRPNSNTRVETLPGAQNLGEIDDALYFRNKLFIALNFPKNYMAQEDSSITRVTLSSVDVKFARLVERLQMSLADGLIEIAIRHLELRGFPANLYEDLQIKMTPPSHWREISENEVVQARYDRALAVLGSGLFSPLDVLVRILKVPAEEAKEIVSRATIQKLQELKLQIMAQNPQLMGIAMPGQDGMEMGTDGQGPNPAIGGPEQMPGTLPPPDGGPQPPQPPQPTQPGGGGGFMKKMGDGDEGRSALDTYGQPQKPRCRRSMWGCSRPSTFRPAAWMPGRLAT
jgi:hypothetical protein